MKPRRTTSTALVLFVAVLGAWFVARSRLTPPAAGPGGTPGGNSATPAAGSATRPASPASTVMPGGASPPPAPTAGLRPPVPGGNSPPPGSPAAASPADATVAAGGSPPPDEAGSINAVKVRRMITDYHTLMGENPVGTNAEIMRAVMGGNPRQATLGPPDGLKLNTSGELVDDWGTPYFFHQLSRDRMEIHSAGPDKIMGTSDDIVVR